MEGKSLDPGADNTRDGPPPRAGRTLLVWAGARGARRGGASPVPWAHWSAALSIRLLMKNSRTHARGGSGAPRTVAASSPGPLHRAEGVVWVVWKGERSPQGVSKRAAGPRGTKKNPLDASLAHRLSGGGVGGWPTDTTPATDTPCPHAHTRPASNSRGKGGGREGQGSTCPILVARPTKKEGARDERSREEDGCAGPHRASQRAMDEGCSEVVVEQLQTPPTKRRGTNPPASP